MREWVWMSLRSKCESNIGLANKNETCKGDEHNHKWLYYANIFAKLASS